MTINPVCPYCANTKAGFTVFEIWDAKGAPAPVKGELMLSAARFDCLACNLDFPLWTYVLGDPASYHANAVDDTGAMFDPANQKASWWESDFVGSSEEAEDTSGLSASPPACAEAREGHG